jgi:hypothetical protein
VGTEAPVSAVRIILSLKALFVPGLSTNHPEKVSELGFVDRFSQAPYTQVNDSIILTGDTGASVPTHR